MVSRVKKTACIGRISSKPNNLYPARDDTSAIMMAKKDNPISTNCIVFMNIILFKKTSC